MTIPKEGALPTHLAGHLTGHLADYLAGGIEEVEGWLSLATAVMAARLVAWQSESGLRGDVCEIGIHHGKFFLVLANAAVAGERAVAVDVFGDQDKNIDRSGSGDRMIFERHVARHAPAASIDIIQASSLDLAEEAFASDRFRFMSIDGGHNAATVQNDLGLAERTLRAGGVAALDDILSHHWTGVLTGLVRYFAAGGTLVPLALLPNKLLLSTDSAAAGRCRAFLRQAFPRALAKCDLEFIGALIDSYDDHPEVYSDTASALRPAPGRQAPGRQGDEAVPYGAFGLGSRLRLLQGAQGRLRRG